MISNGLPTPELVSVLKISPDIQIDLLKKFVDRTNAWDKNMDIPFSPEGLLVIREEMLDEILAKVEELLKTDACSIYIKDSPVQATLRAARGYQKSKIGKAVRKIVPTTSVKDKPTDDERLGLTSWVISTGRSFLATSPDDFFNHPHWSGTFDKHLGDEIYEKQKRIAAFLAIPLRDSRGQVIGALKAQRFEPNASFSVEDQITLEALGQVAGRCIAYVDDALNGPIDAAITSWALKIFSDASTTEGELDAFLDIVGRVSAAVTMADACSIFLVDESRRTLTQRAGCGHQSLKNIIRSYSLPDRSKLAGCIDFETCTPATCRNKPGTPIPEDERVGITAWVAATGKSFYANSKEELRQHCHHKGLFDPQNFEQQKDSELQKQIDIEKKPSAYLEECSAWFGTPLILGGTPMGVLKIENKTLIGQPDSRQFSTEVKQRLEILSQDIAISIRRLQIQGKTRYEVINNALPTILTILQGGLDIHQLIERVVVETANLFNARACALFLKEGNKLIQPKWAAYGYATQTKGEEGAYNLREYNLVSKKVILPNPPDNKKVGLTVWIAVTQTKFSARSNQELKLHPHWIGRYDPLNFREEERCESFMGVPLLVGEKKKKDLIGVLKVETKQRKVGDRTDYSYFNEQDALVFDLIANSVAIAIQNARLLASRRLADQLLIQQNRYNTLLKVFEFIEDRVDVLNTLEGATRLVAQSDNRRAAVLESVIGILKPNFNVTFIEQFAQKLSDANDPNYVGLVNLLNLISDMIDVKKWTEIYKIQVIDAQTPVWFNKQFVLYKCQQILLDVHHKVSDFLKAYDRDGHTQALRNCIKLLSDQIGEIESQNLFIRNVLNKIFTQWKKLVEMELAQQHEIHNPYVAGLPLEANSSVFFGREEIFEWIEEHLHGEKGVLILHGGWHIGKTSILKQLVAGPLGERIRERNALLPVFVDLQRLADPGIGIFFENLKELICKALQSLKIPLPEAAKDNFNETPYRTFDKFISQVNETIQKHEKQYLLIMLDEFELLYERVKNNKLDSDIFQYLRSLMQHEAQVSFILAGRHPLDEMALEVRTPIFNVAYHKEIGFLDSEAANRLVVEPVKPYGVEYEEKSVNRILKLTAGHPLFIQQLCKNCIDILNRRKKGYLVTIDILDEALQMALYNNIILLDLWKIELDEKDRKIVGMLAEMIDQDNVWVKESDLLNRIQANVQELTQALQKPLIRKLILYRTSSSDDTEYAFGVDILRLWIKGQAASRLSG